LPALGRVGAGPKWPQAQAFAEFSFGEFVESSTRRRGVTVTPLRSASEEWRVFAMLGGVPFSRAGEPLRLTRAPRKEREKDAECEWPSYPAPVL
jgi:hypothetical protein